MQVGMELQCVSSLTAEGTRTGGNTLESTHSTSWTHNTLFCVVSSIHCGKMQLLLLYIFFLSSETSKKRHSEAWMLK